MDNEVLDIFSALIGVASKEPTDRERALWQVVEYAESLDWGHEDIEPVKKKKDKKLNEYLQRIGVETE